jgi:gliding motility-associated-like protein
LLKYPHYFTPNGDGVNDNWKVYGPIADYFSSAELQLFNRFGTILYSSDLMSEDPGWDGTFNASNLPASDYWYKVTFQDLNNQIISKTGHFSLIR